MALQLSAFCTSQVFDSVKAQRQPQRRSKYSLGLSDSPMTKCSPWMGQAFVKRSLSSMNINIIKRSSKLLVSASLPTLPPPVHIASTLFTLGTALVVPFYTAIILAPHAKWTRKLIESSFPYVVLGIMYTYLLFLSWTPETLPLMFASKYWLPELPGITRMFSSTLTVASAWIHLLAVDLFAGRQIYLDGLQNAIETRHSLVLCLLFCPVGMLSHFFTKAMVKLGRKASNAELPDAAKLYS